MLRHESGLVGDHDELHPISGAYLGQDLDVDEKWGSRADDPAGSTGESLSYQAKDDTRLEECPNDSKQTMIQAQGLTKHYGDKVAVDHLSFEVRPGS